MSYLCKCSVDLPHGAVGWSAVCDCGISCSYSLTNGYVTALDKFAKSTIDFTTGDTHQFSIISRVIEITMKQTNKSCYSEITVFCSIVFPDDV